MRANDTDMGNAGIDHIGQGKVDHAVTAAKGQRTDTAVLE
ncbi:hypothetical protein SDC9_151024 [bioreactor metagenome]|uniref:Uncharacterized protein n=1 Tax=bioreactor metagenome TaxID=1076179 RepID=A0A645ER23_9ZZZZ